MKTLKESLLSNNLTPTITDPRVLAQLRDKYWGGVDVMEWMEGKLYIKAFRDARCFNFAEFVRLTGIRDYEFVDPVRLDRCGSLKDIHIISHHTIKFSDSSTWDRLYDVESIDHVTYNGIPTSILYIVASNSGKIKIRDFHIPHPIISLFFYCASSIDWDSNSVVITRYLIYQQSTKFVNPLTKRINKLGLGFAIHERLADLKDRILQLSGILKLPSRSDIETILIRTGKNQYFCLGGYDQEIREYNPYDHVDFEWEMFKVGNAGTINNGMRPWCLAINEDYFRLPAWVRGA